ncbi:hypothetical protein L228DRAFT_242633 [Xylona heveae TC161]|uniref:Fungal-type protein kinase domain-containing protein n=1 Tax=Xylona heveae (strain CBS 132557 / TC161) TaxID=1328760 RepID=A0A165JGA6_XYLHT|nr:hypothetical protein L228DRAFT_242633 [Xylona heveae TC161]KZF26200.1 hypothetical protein L228DRAFT_242633 [Xylona heveae TC161]
MVTPLRAQDFISSRLPDLLTGSSQTTSLSTHDLEFKATLVHWTAFENEVRSTFRSTPWSAEILGYAAQNRQSSLDREQIICGDESSIVGRFNQHVGQVMGSVFRTLDISLWFGDYRASPDVSMGGDTPDIVVMDGDGLLKLVGEAKTPWRHNIASTMLQPQERLRRYLGQISRYMYIAKIKFGFLTTYNQTIFFKQEPDPRKRGRWVLWHSNTIWHHTPSQQIGDPVPGDYREKVSVRECFLFLAKKIASGDFSALKHHAALRLGWPAGRSNL